LIYPHCSKILHFESTTTSDWKCMYISVQKCYFWRASPPIDRYLLWSYVSDVCFTLTCRLLHALFHWFKYARTDPNNDNRVFKAKPYKSNGTV
jgi:hypothetical protein